MGMPLQQFGGVSYTAEHHVRRGDALRRYVVNLLLQLPARGFSDHSSGFVEPRAMLFRRAARVFQDFVRGVRPVPACERCDSFVDRFHHVAAVVESVPQDEAQHDLGRALCVAAEPFNAAPFRRSERERLHA
jgi:hypothetical protein